MPSKKEIEELCPSARAMYESEREKRLARKDRRTKWLVDATEKDKKAALRVALNGIGGGKKYSWLNEAPTSVAQTLGQKRAVELGIRDGKLAKELKIGKYDKSLENGGPKDLVISFSEMRGAGFNITKEEFEKTLRDVGTPEDEIRRALGEETASNAAAKPAAKPASATPADTATPAKAPAAASRAHTTAAASSKRRKLDAGDEGEDDRQAKNKKKQRVSALSTPPKSSSPAPSSFSTAAQLDAVANTPIVLGDKKNKAARKKSSSTKPTVIADDDAQGLPSPSPSSSS
ncbi:hypothetical protein GGS21DRAFT_493178 [Xylaria nigripes]|nr:hypothetical protein GGS21DRAFT_493178 [Xylaria nigripes]